MYKLVAVLLICTTLSVGCAPIASIIAPPTPAYHPGFSIVMNRTWRNCRDGTTIDGDGSVHYSGPSCWGSQTSGQSKSGTIPAREVEELIAAIQKADAFALEDHYATSSVCMDCTTTILSITLDGQNKRISDYAGCAYGSGWWPWDKVPDVPPPPGRLCELERKVKTIVQSVEWDTIWANPTNTTHPAGGSALGAEVVRYVKPNGESSGSCSTWASSCTLQYALSIASPGEQLWVAKGTYMPTTSSDRTLSFDLKDGVAIYGGFAGTETELTKRRPTVNVTILSGDLGAAGDAGDNSYHVVTASNVTSTAVLDGFTITGGNANGVQPPSNYGGGMFIHNASPTLTTLIFSHNTAILGGGMLTDIGSYPVLTNVSFLDNTAEAYGGGMYNGRKANPTLQAATFSGNRVTQGGGAGGGVYNSYNSPLFSNVTFEGNSAAEGGAGGGMLNHDSSPSLKNVTFSNNTATDTGIGDAMYSYGNSKVVIVNSIFWDDAGRGEVVNQESVATITNSIVKGGCPDQYSNCNNVLNVDPLLRPLQDNGGFVQTMALGPRSPAIDAGGKDGDCEPVDARGMARPQGAACDLGAYEVGP